MPVSDTKLFMQTSNERKIQKSNPWLLLDIVLLYVLNIIVLFTFSRNIPILFLCTVYATLPEVKYVYLSCFLCKSNLLFNMLNKQTYSMCTKKPSGKCLFYQVEPGKTFGSVAIH